MSRPQARGVSPLSILAKTWYRRGFARAELLGSKVGTKRFTFTPGRWFHVELENMNWTTRTFDLRLDEALVAIALPLAGPQFNFVESVWISSTGYAYFDEIVFN